jgi:glutamine transport system permease protein
MGYTLNFSAVWRSFDQLLWGLALSLGLAFVAIAIGCVLGLITAFGLLSKQGALRHPARIYVTVIRNTPILVLVLFTFFALPQLGIRLGKIESFVATLALYSGAYLAEVFRGGLLAVPNGLKEAGLAIGLTQSQIRSSIVMPLMLRNVCRRCRAR